MADEVFFPPLLNNFGEFQPSNMIFDKALAKNVKSFLHFFTLFSSHSKFFYLESIKPIKLLILGKFWVMRQNNSKITDKNGLF